MSDDYKISELRVDEESWLSNKSLIDLDLRKEGIIVLGIQPEDGDYVGSPNGSSLIKPHDIITMYGKEETFLNLNQRQRNWKGEMEHQKAVKDLQDS